MTTLTLNLKAIAQRLLQAEPDLSAWIEFTNIYIDKTDANSQDDYFTELVIDCSSRVVVQLFLRNIQRLQKALQPISIEINLLCRGDFIVSWQNMGLKLLHQKLEPITMSNTLLEQETIRETTVAKEQAIDLKNLSEPIKSSVLSQVAALHLPVYLKPDGGYDLPETSFDLAWQSLGESFKTGTPIFTDKPTKEGTKNSQNGATQSAKTGETQPRLMRQKFTALDIKTGKNGITNTLKNFISKVNMKGRTTEEVWSAIASPDSEYGQQLREKLRETYAEKNPGMTEKNWTDTLSKISQAATQMLQPSPEGQEMSEASEN